LGAWSGLIQRNKEGEESATLLIMSTFLLNWEGFRGGYTSWFITFIETGSQFIMQIHDCQMHLVCLMIEFD
jgi:hypothetical protein